MFDTFLGYFAGILTTGGIIPEIMKFNKTKKVEGLSYIWLFITIIGLISWTVYGYFIRSLPLAILSGISAVLYLILTGLKFRYSMNKKFKLKEKHKHTTKV
ncbi:MAG: SemiSWEET family sugar transporter [Candidatus Micrarchaeia archaeon]